jgi:hypothetical protein
MRRGAERRTWRAAALLAAAWSLPLAAQEADAPRAPRIIGAPATPAVTPAPDATAPSASVLSLRPPSATRLAPLPDERANDIEEIVIVGEGWRLPDLGSEWRARQEELARSGRFSATLLPLYDPTRPPLRAESLLASGEERRHGYIELFRLRFGRRARN